MAYHTKAQRLLIAGSTGMVVGLIASVVTHQWQYLFLATWDGIAAATLLLLWKDLHDASSEHTATLARRDEFGVSATDAVLVGASLASLVAVGSLFAFHDHTWWQVGFALLSIILSWATVHATYTLRYAAMYFDEQSDGIDFSATRHPTFIDFAYVAFTLGMTYQVSDTTFTSTRFRRVALGHALLSFIFGTAIIAVSINSLASLAG